MDEIIKELEKLRAHSAQYGYGLVEDREFGSILCRLKAKAVEGMVKSAIKRCAICGEEDVVVNVCAKCLSKAVEVEPLAVLADRKGLTTTAMSFPTKRFPQGFNIIIHSMHGDVIAEWAGPTYAAAEKAAREFLNKLEDVK